MPATQQEDGRWRCDHCGNLYVSEARALACHPSESGPALEVTAEVMAQMLSAMDRLARIGDAAAEVFATAEAEHADLREKLAALAQTAAELNSLLQQVIARLNAAGIPPIDPADQEGQHVT